MDKFTVRKQDGSVDVAASTEAYATALSKWVNTHEVSNEEIDKQLSLVFDDYPGNVPTNFLVCLAARNLSVNSEAFPALKKRVHSFLKMELASSTKYALLRGVGGGVTRISKSSD